jgi:hypothetical protein
MRRTDRKSQEKKWICEISRFCVERRNFEIVWTKSERNLNLKNFEIWKNKLIFIIFMKDLIKSLFDVKIVDESLDIVEFFVNFYDLFYCRISSLQKRYQLFFFD